MSDYKLVSEFNTAAEQKCESRPTPFNKEEATFLTKMMLDELCEFMITIDPNYKQTMINLINDSKNLKFNNELNGIDLVAEQVDALVDSYYYSLNGCVKKGIDFSKVFLEVHNANMNKRDPVTGKFLKREDGKIIKPVGFSEPNIKNVLTE